MGFSLFIIDIADWIFTNGQQTYKIEKLKDKNEVLSDKIKELNHIESTSSASENKAFLKRFLIIPT